MTANSQSTIKHGTIIDSNRSLFALIAGVNVRNMMSGMTGGITWANRATHASRRTIGRQDAYPTGPFLLFPISYLPTSIFH